MVQDPRTMSRQATPLTATSAKQYAAQILKDCSDCFTDVKARKAFGQWVIDINGGSAACYGRTAKNVEAAEDILRIFAN